MVDARLVSLLALATFFGGGWCPGDELRYRFRVGEELVYEQTGSQDLLAPPASYAASRPLDRRFRLVVTPIRENPDGSWRLMIRVGVTLFRFREDIHPKTRFRNEFLSYLDLSPDGSYQENPTLGDNTYFNLVPEVLFPPLPRGRAAPRASLTTDATYDLRNLSVLGRECQVGGPVTTPLDARYNNHASLLVDFDREAGHPVRLRRDSAGGDTGEWFHTATTIELIEVRQRIPEWIDEYTTSAERFLAVRERFNRVLEDANNDDDPVVCRRRLDALAESIRRARAEERLPELSAAYERSAAMLQQESKWVIDRAAKRAAVYGLAPLDWEAVDLDNEPSFTREGLAGKVVLLDFWYRGCSHCIRALPALKRVRQRFAGRPLVMVGVNKDRDPADARHVIEVFEIPYPTIRDQLPTPVGDHERISDAYGVTGWPTFVVLKPEGRVSAVLVGNSDRLEADLTAAIERALSDAP